VCVKFSKIGHWDPVTQKGDPSDRGVAFPPGWARMYSSAFASADAINAIRAATIAPWQRSVVFKTLLPDGSALQGRLRALAPQDAQFLMFSEGLLLALFHRHGMLPEGVC
jgi:hypothetical protein